MKRTLCVWITIAAIASGAWAQSSQGSLQALIGPLQTDLESLMSSMGRDIAPELLQTALAGDIVGEAAFKGNFPHGSLTLPIPAIGLSLGNGIATALNDSSYPWQFVVPLGPSSSSSGLIDTTLPKTGIVRDIYQASRQVAPYPSFAFGFGFAPFRDIEVLASGFYLPQVATDWIVGLASSPTITALKPQLSTTSVLLKVRKVFFRDSGGFPAMSLALGGLYSDLNLGASVDLASLNGDKAIDLTGIGTLNLAGPLAFNTSVYGGGLEFAISKRIPLITPFAKVGVWYRHSVVRSTLDFNATIAPTGSTDPSNNVIQPITTSSTATDDAIDANIGAGLEFRIFAMIVHLQANLDLENPLIDIRELSLTGIAANGFSANIGLRWAF